MSEVSAVRGMPSIIDADMRRGFEQELINLVRSFGYQEIRPPIVEKTELFRRSIGDATDIVEKEMYEFTDKKGLSICLRPEATAGLMRTGIEHNLFTRSMTQVMRMWCIGPMFRYERPQSGRLRQFDQLDLEIVGASLPSLDAELMWLSSMMWERLGIRAHLKINALGSKEVRKNYDSDLKTFLRNNYDDLDQESKVRLERAPLRILDSKNPETRKILTDAPKISDYWDDETKKHLEDTCGILAALDVKYEIDTSLVRGLDYYDKIVFEWQSDDLGAQNTICAGGRYDGLIKQLGGPDTPAVGFALGIERLLLSINGIAASKTDLKFDNHKLLILPTVKDKGSDRKDIKATGNDADESDSNLLERQIFQIIQQLRTELPDLKMECDWTLRSLKAKLKSADKQGVDYVVLLGSDELSSKSVILRSMKKGEQQKILLNELSTKLKSTLRL